MMFKCGDVFHVCRRTRYQKEKKITVACFILSATYCIVIFALMLLSLLETILVTHLIEKDSQVKLKVKNEHKKAKTNKSDAGEIRKKLLRY